MQRRLAIAGITDEVVQLLPLLEANPELELILVFDPDLEAARTRLASLAPHERSSAEEKLSDDPARLEALADLHAVIDAGLGPPAGECVSRLVGRGVQAVSPLTARLLFAPGISNQEHRTELLQALNEIVESVDLTVDPTELYSRILEAAMGVTGADGGSLMLLDPEDDMLRVVWALGVERELWSKIRVRLGEGIAGRVAAEARPLWLRGPADHEQFKILRDRRDLESSLCIPLVRGRQVLGVLNLHSAEPDAFLDEDTEFVEQLGRLDGEIIARAQERDELRRGATRYEAVREVRQALSGNAPLLDRLGELCRRVAKRAGEGIVTLYLHDPDEGELRLAATSLIGGGFAGEYRFRLGQGVDGQVGREHVAAFLRGGDGAIAYAALPLLDGERLVGVLAVQCGTGPRGGDAGGLDERSFQEFLGEIAAAAADEIADADREASLAARATRMNAINEMGCRLLSCEEVAEVASLAASSAALILTADHAIVRLQDEDTLRYVIRSYYGTADGNFQERLFRLDKRVSVDVIKSRNIALVRDVESEPGYRSADTGVRSLLAAPLKQEGRVIGTLGLYEKVAADRFYPGIFNDEDLRVFSKYVSYVERAAADARRRARARLQRNFDDLTGLPNARYLGRRIDQELARSAGQPGSLALVLCRIENLDEIREQGDPVRAERVLLRTAEALQDHLRDFDVLGRVENGEFAAVLPDPGPDPEERVYALARASAEVIARDDDLNDPVRVALGFGYAIAPEEGKDRNTLIERASQPRIRML